MTPVVLQFKLEFDGKIPSVNSMYNIGRSGNRAWLYLDPEAVRFKGRTKTQLELDDVYKKLEKVTEAFGETPVMVKCKMVFVYRDNFWQRDVTNLIKLTEDAVKDTIGIDDSVTIGFSTDKVYNDLDDFEYVVLVLEIQPKDVELVKLSRYSA